MPVFQGYDRIIHNLFYGLPNSLLPLMGCMKQGAITTPFNLTVRNHISRYRRPMGFRESKTGNGIFTGAPATVFMNPGRCRLRRQPGG
ncbi:phosphoketolase family protein [Niabella drilacis]|uniref:phosphoketolase family protein n=1 Tax=Niabella drilacis (strain DSM 25811 / CCM 8410 / CCUG 62505 / LMG 26954 / E90) TaxID=1285928 RepID=UPI000B829B0F